MPSPRCVCVWCLQLLAPCDEELLDAVPSGSIVAQASAAFVFSVFALGALCASCFLLPPATASAHGCTRGLQEVVSNLIVSGVVSALEVSHADFKVNHPGGAIGTGKDSAT